MTNPRRTFLKQSGLMAAGLAVAPSILYSKNPGTKDISQILKNLSQLNDTVIEELLLNQIDKSGDRWDGGVMDRFELPNAHATNDFIMKLGAAYVSPYSKYHLSERLENPLEKAIQCLLNVQHNDGTIDLHSTNFHSTPDTAFIVNYLRDRKSVV